MNRDAFTAFVTEFGHLNPYELDYFCKKLCETYKAIIDEASLTTAHLNQACFTLALTHTMRLLKIEATAEKIKNAEAELQAAKQQTFTEQNFERAPARIHELAEQAKKLSASE